MHCCAAGSCSGTYGSMLNTHVKIDSARRVIFDKWSRASCRGGHQRLLPQSCRHYTAPVQRWLATPVLQHHTYSSCTISRLYAVAGSPAQQEQQQVFEQGFDLPLAIALAAAAFEAYLEPSGVDPQLIQTLRNETYVTYTDRNYVRETFTGLMQLTIHSASGLKAVNITGGSDPYVVASLGDSVGTTEVKWGELEPVWEETFTLYVPRKEKQILRLRMIDKNKLLSDVDMGTVMVAISDLIEKPGQKLALQLQGSNNAQGTLTISGQFLPFEDELLAATVVEEKQLPEVPDEMPQADGPMTVAADKLQEAVAAGVEVMQQAVGKETVAAVQGMVETAVQEVVTPIAGQAAEAIKAISSTDNSKVVAEASAKEELPKEKGQALQEVVESVKASAVQGLAEAIDQVGARLAEQGLVQQAKVVQQSKDVVVEQIASAADSISEFVQKEGLPGIDTAELQNILAMVATSRLPKKEQAANGNAETAAGAAAADAASSGTIPPALSPEAMPAAWKALASVAGKVVDDVFHPVAYIENEETDTQVWVSVSRELREVVVAFRGTEQVKWKDFVSDINLIPQTLDVERTGGIDLGIGTIPMPFADFKKNKELMVHSGFLSAYDSIKVKVLNLVDTLTADASEERPWQIFVTGHSLGGALATLCAYDLAGRRGPSAEGKTVFMYTYGAPRVGNKAFADAFDDRLQGRSWRITNSSDIVPSVPRLMGYAHVRTGVQLNAMGKLKFERKTKDVLGEGREVADVVTDLASQALEVAQGSKSMEDVVDVIRNHEMKILNALIDGSALGQHMEDFYLATLKEAVLAADPALAGKVEKALKKAAAAAQAPATSTAAEASANADEAGKSA